jgi:hypothetical protein
LLVATKQQFKDLSEDVQDAFKGHTLMGQYEDGGYMNNGGKTSEVRKFFKTGVYKYILINEKRANNFSMWSNKESSLQKFIDDITDKELASEFKIYETKIQFDGKPINLEDIPTKLRKDYKLHQLRDKNGVADKFNTKNYTSLLILDDGIKMANGKSQNVSHKDSIT